MIKDYYKILEVLPSSTMEEIKRSYRRFALKYHPDVSKNAAAHDRFIEIHEAYEILSSFNKREIYDKFYNSYFNAKKQLPEIKINDSFKYWQNQARDTGEKYSKMPTNEFKNTVLDLLVTVYDTSKKTVKFGCFMYFGLSFLGVALLSIYMLIKGIVEGNYTMNFTTLFFLSMGVVITILCGVIGWLSLKKAID